MNVTEVRDSDFENAFPGIFNFTVGILSQNFRLRFLELFGFEFLSVKSEQEPRWEKVPKGEEVKHMYLDPRNQIQGGFGGVKRVDFGQREKRIADLKKQLDEECVKIGRITKWTVRIVVR